MNNYVQRELLRKNRERQPKPPATGFTVCTVGLGALVAVAAVGAGMSL